MTNTPLKPCNVHTKYVARCDWCNLETEQAEKEAMTNPIPEAIEALWKALNLHDDFYSEADTKRMHRFIGRLEAQGFTIIRQPAMTDAELEREAYELADAVSKASCKGQISAATLRNNVVSLAKKCRG